MKLQEYFPRSNRINAFRQKLWIFSCVETRSFILGFFF